MQIARNENKIILQDESGVSGAGVVVFIMAALGLFVIFSMFPLEEGYGAGDILGILFVFVWETVVIFSGVYLYRIHREKISIDNSGVWCESHFGKEFISWSDIKDWGLSYCGQTRFQGNTYYLYF